MRRGDVYQLRSWFNMSQTKNENESDNEISGQKTAVTSSQKSKKSFKTKRRLARSLLVTVSRDFTYIFLIPIVYFAQVSRKKNQVKLTRKLNTTVSKPSDSEF